MKLNTIKNERLLPSDEGRWPRLFVGDGGVENAAQRIMTELQKITLEVKGR